MPSYDVECSHCGFKEVVLMKISEVNAWDSSAVCPKCEKGSGEFRRVIRAVSGNMRNANAGPGKKAFSSAERDDMRHKESKTRDRDKVAEAVENVRRGTFEGF